MNLRTLFLQGGRGSGNFGHKGRPGQVGGSLSTGSIGISSQIAKLVKGKRDKRYSKIVEMISKIPENELKGIKEISLSPKIGPPIAQGFGHLSGGYNTVTKKITVFSNSSIPNETIAHEVGHNVYNQMLEYDSSNFYERLRARKTWDNVCRKRYKKSKFITWYDSFNEDPNETFAELYKIYNTKSGRDKKKLREFLLSEDQDDTELEKPFFDIVDLAG